MNKKNNYDSQKDSIWIEKVKMPPIKTTPIIDKGEQYKLMNKYVLWSHDLFNKDWSITSYNKIHEITNVSEFWQLFNNFHRIGLKYSHFFLMKDGINPTWEDISNRNGGICSIRIELNDSPEIWNDLGINMVCEILNDDPNDINGISISPKNNWAIIKIWNKDCNSDLTTTISPNIIEKYKNYSIKYKENIPEY